MKDGSYKFPLFAVLYVDDILLVFHDKSHISDIKGKLKIQFDMKDLGEALKILGVKIIGNKTRNLILLSQHEYPEKVLSMFCMENSTSTPIPLEVHRPRRIVLPLIQ